MKQIDYEILLKNVYLMINLLEFDSMRSGGKCKMNAPTLESLFAMADRYEAKLAPAPVKKTPGPKAKS